MIDNADSRSDIETNVNTLAGKPEGGAEGEKVVTRGQVSGEMAKGMYVVIGCFEKDNCIPFEKLVSFVTWKKKLERVFVNLNRGAFGDFGRVAKMNIIRYG